jgi:hypothetical protein
MRREEQRFQNDLSKLATREPFEPFRIRLVNGDFHDIFYPQNVVVTKTIVNIHAPDQNWVFFPIDKIASVESLIADYQGELNPLG